MPEPRIVVGGVSVPLEGGACCAHYLETGLEFTAANTRLRTRVSPVDLVVVHDTGGEGGGRRVYRTLLARRLSVHFLVDRAGLVWQYCDPATSVAAHVGPGNGRSVGIEVTNVMLPLDDPATPANERRLFNLGRLSELPSRLLHGRPVLVEPYRGRGRRVLGHLPVQRASVAALVRALLRAFPAVQRRLPRGPDGQVHGDRLPDGWSGVSGHLHWSEDGWVSARAHVDPALDVFSELSEL